MTRSELADLREDFLHERTALLKRRVSAAELKLYDLIVKKVIEEFTLSGGNLKDTNANVEIANRLDRLFKEFNKSEYFNVIKQFAGDLVEFQSMNAIYFKIIAEDNKKLEKISKEVNKTMRSRIGLNTKGNLVKDGYLDRLLKDDVLLKQVKKQTYKSVTSGESLKTFTDKMKTLIVGNKSVEGGLQRHFNTFAYDTYAAFDRTTQKLYATKLGLKAFIYAGGKIKTSRPFCVKNNGKVFTTDEAEKWSDILDEPDGPQWGDNSGAYSPLEDLGGHRCRHLPNFIGNREAISRRSELAEVLR